MKFKFLSILLVMCSACSLEQVTQVDTLITNATIVDVASGMLKADQLIVIEDDTIRLVGDMSQADQYLGKTLIDAKGLFLMPGLWDNHVHFRGGDSLAEENKNLLPLFLAYGITTVRDAGGNLASEIINWKSAIQTGELDGPQIFTPGLKLDGPEPAWPGSIRITDDASIEAALDSLESLHVDYVKMYDGSLSPENFYRIIEAARARGLRTTGHMPMNADLMKALSLGLNGSEHMYYAMKPCSPLADSLSAAKLGYKMLPLLLESYSDSLAQQRFADYAKNNLYITPTLYIGKILGELADTDHSGDSLLPAMGPGIIKTYQRRIETARRQKETGVGIDRKSLGDQFRAMIKPMIQAGVPITAGSDCGASNSFVYPGAALHGELMELQNAGLSPQEVLKASIITGPAFLEKEKYYGSLDRNKVADLIFLTKNPLEDVRNAQTIEMVFTNNKLYTKKMLKDFLP